MGNVITSSKTSNNLHTSNPITGMSDKIIKQQLFNLNDYKNISEYFYSILKKINKTYFMQANNIIQIKEFSDDDRHNIIKMIKTINAVTFISSIHQKIISKTYLEIYHLFFTTDLEILETIYIFLKKILETIHNKPDIITKNIKFLFNNLILENLFSNHSPYTNFFDNISRIDLKKRIILKTNSNLYLLNENKEIDIHFVLSKNIKTYSNSMENIQKLPLITRFFFYCKDKEIKLLSDFNLTLLHISLLFNNNRFIDLNTYKNTEVLKEYFQKLANCAHEAVFIIIADALKNNKENIMLNDYNMMKKYLCDHNFYCFNDKKYKLMCLLISSGFANLLYYCILAFTDVDNGKFFNFLSDFQKLFVHNIEILIFIHDYLNLTNQAYQSLIYHSGCIKNISKFKNSVRKILIPNTSDSDFNKMCIAGARKMINDYYKSGFDELYIESFDKTIVLKDFYTLLLLLIETLIYNPVKKLNTEILPKTENLLSHLRGILLHNNKYIKKLEILIWIIKRYIKKGNNINKKNIYVLELNEMDEEIKKIIKYQFEGLKKYENELLSIHIFKKETHAYLIRMIYDLFFPHTIISLLIVVKRENIFNEMRNYYIDWNKNKYPCVNFKLKIKFKNEDGEYGIGLLKIWGTLLGHEFLNIKTRMFEMVDPITRTYSPFVCLNPSESRLKNFEFLGWFIAVSLNMSLLVNFKFPNYIYRMILGSSELMNKEERMDIVKLLHVKEKHFKETGEIEYYITILDEKDEFVDFDISFSSNNKENDVVKFEKFSNDIYRYFMSIGIKEQINSLKKGFDRFIDPKYRPKDEYEFHDLICGDDEICVENWKNNTTYENFNEITVGFFWSYVASLSAQEKTFLLYLITGSESLPTGGFQNLKPTFNIHLSPASYQFDLPKVFTCSNTIILINVTSQDEMNTKMNSFIEVCKISGITLY
ncbi:E3 ubiquitin-protein ligase TOM1 [Astathelohania contejeani]|uniref:HECT-type E3 ubiquitin transferase n=1 Tax=Astathelohania contejeani TaxID=164912 RepID=A0ABQ7HXW3_9MICR|nr:E3 ubiquitin-protein ligase TOM1 [Thelohania contejeani]